MRLHAVLVLAVLTATTGCAARAGDFGSVVSGVEQQYAVHAQRVPLMGFISLCARFGTGGAVKGLRIAEFDHLSLTAGNDRLVELVRSQLDAQWQPFVTSRDKDGAEQTVIFVKPAGHALRFLIADYEHGELDIVRMELNGEMLAKWMHDPRGEAHHAGSKAKGEDHQAKAGDAEAHAQ